MRFRRTLLAGLVLLAPTHAAAQTWLTTTDDYIRDQVTRVAQTRDGRFLAVADTGRALALIKRNSDGSLLWQRQLMGAPTGEAGRDFFELSDGRLAAAGDMHVSAHGNDDAAFVVLSPDAAVVHLQRSYGGPEGDDRALALVSAADGGWLLVGETLSWGWPGRSMLAVRLDPAASVVWAIALTSPDGDDVIYAGQEIPTGGFLVGGGAGQLARLAPDGGVVWSRRYGLTEIRGMAALPGGRILLAGFRSAGANDVAELILIDTTGDILRRASYGQSGVTYRFFAVAATDDGGCLAAGEVNGPDTTDLNGWLVRLDADGDIVWQRRLDGPGEVHSVTPTSDGGVLAGGVRGSFPSMMMARLDPGGGAAECGHTATMAMKLPSSGGWTDAPLTPIAPATLVAREADKTVSDAPGPSDRTVCLGGPVLRPSEVSPPAAAGAALRFLDAQTLAWEAATASASTSFDLYRGEPADLASGAGLGCLWPGLTAAGATDSDLPAPGAVFAYLVAGLNSAGSGTLGHASDGSERPTAVPCR